MTKGHQPKLTWGRKEDEAWAASVELRLVLDHDAPAGLADDVLTEAHQLVHEADRTALDLLGDPDSYARSVADERIPEEHRARIDAHGLTPGERISGSFVSLGVGGLLFCGFEWLRDGLQVGIGWPSFTITAAVVLGATLATAALAARAAGRVRGAWYFAAAAAGAVCTAVGATPFVPTGQLFAVPAPVLMVVCLAAIAAAVKFPDTTLDRWFTPAPCSGDDEAWFARLDGLLRGRHAMPSAQARDHVREARHHLAATPGTEPAADVFGDVEVYALRLSDGPRRSQRLARRQFYGSCLLAVCLTILLIDNLTDPDTSPFWLAVNTGALGATLWSLLGEWRRSTKRTTPTSPDPGNSPSPDTSS
ncbi:hypothetical protein [Streptomyces flavofungini]|uniref:hypothetical protein n=1 Tax=Streptomyces flavofungini TaxID=68200 RepID=UPI0025B1B61C|nr:hypothetical protein [Streptomyces flavofungini]WJV47906.1 hypothetical protein QUY26_21760 [Streptomyces flavofungini]